MPSLGFLARELGATAVHGNPDWELKRLVHPLSSTDAHDLVVVLSLDIVPKLADCPAQTLVVPAGIDPEKLPAPLPVLAQGLEGGIIEVPRPRLAMAQLLRLFDDTPQAVAKGVHPTAVVAASAKLGAEVAIGPYVVIGENAIVGDAAILHPHVSIGAEAVVGASSILHAGVRIGHRVRLGQRVIIHANAVIGADGFSYVTPEAGSVETLQQGGSIAGKNTALVKLPSLGTVVLGNDVEIGACTTIDRSNLGETVIGDGTKVDNLVMIGHNNTLGENCLIVSQVGLAGSCKIGDRVVIAGQAGLKDHLTIGDDAVITAKAGVMTDVPEKAVMVGLPAQPQREAFAQIAELRHLRELRKEVRALRKELDALRDTKQDQPAPVGS